MGSKRTTLMLVLSFWQSFYVFQINFSSSLLSNDIASSPPLFVPASSFSFALDIQLMLMLLLMMWNVKCENSFFYIWKKKRGRKKPSHCSRWILIVNFLTFNTSWMGEALHIFIYFAFLLTFFPLSQCVFLRSSLQLRFFPSLVYEVFKCYIYFWLLCCHSSALTLMSFAYSVCVRLYA